ncbi:Oidioi.mRNA.OKI2018_I69.XSR.g15615.t1.cds [Oikopleura dioica]|uniref:Oidioi.mRNA.OKI2018_I69.XSR.g15615.t1.cds n=1 Tax=Oikopleura dioica TaxID=34765 RepID=A0ABN7SIJ9_OIKDI|nr:Oidioi.mRNA.OKI2018_I69.XSR.g15615.t1.cds [Oikopleura dioica]
MFQEEKASFPLIPTLTTIATLQNVEITHLGHPYKKCILDENYKRNTCEYEKIIEGYKRKCQCYPGYLSDELKDKMNDTDPCSFFQHATCIAPLQTNTEHRAELKAIRCHPKCQYTTIEKGNVNHVELNSEHLNFVRETVNLTKDIDLISTVISLNDEPNWILRTEEADYKLSELLSDMGGSMSLILGLRSRSFEDTFGTATPSSTPKKIKIQRPDDFEAVHPDSVTSIGKFGKCEGTECDGVPAETIEINKERLCQICAKKKHGDAALQGKTFDKSDAVFKCPAFSTDGSCNSDKISFHEFYLGSCCEQASKWLTDNDKARKKKLDVIAKLHEDIEREKKRTKRECEEVKKSNAQMENLQRLKKVSIERTLKEIEEIDRKLGKKREVQEAMEKKLEEKDREMDIVSKRYKQLSYEYHEITKKDDEKEEEEENSGAATCQVCFEKYSDDYESRKWLLRHCGHITRESTLNVADSYPTDISSNGSYFWEPFFDGVHQSCQVEAHFHDEATNSPDKNCAELRIDYSYNDYNDYSHESYWKETRCDRIDHDGESYYEIIVCMVLQEERTSCDIIQKPEITTNGIAFTSEANYDYSTQRMEESTSNSQQSLYTKLSTDYIATTLSYDRTSQTNNAPTTESGGTVTRDTMPDERRLNILIILCSMIGASNIPLKNSSGIARQEDWEKSAVANFSYQELQHNYQSDALQSALQSNIQFAGFESSGDKCYSWNISNNKLSGESFQFKDASIVRLNANRVQSLNSIGSSVTFPKCRAFYAGKNHFNSFDDLPGMPLVEHVDLRQTNISSANGIQRFPNLHVLIIEECPLAFTEDFRGYLASQNKNIKLINNIAVTFDEQNFKPPKKNEKKKKIAKILIFSKFCDFRVI